MAVAWFRNPDLDESAPIVDRVGIDVSFGVRAKRHPAYVFSIGKNAALMHRVAYVEMDWYVFVDGGAKVARLKRPAMVARTVCGMTKFLVATKTRTCKIPSPDSVLCGRCHGKMPTFSKAWPSGIKRSEANARLACEVNGYPTTLDVIREGESESAGSGSATPVGGKAERSC